MSTINATTHRISGKEPHIISLTLLSGFAAMGAILMTPALPAIAHFFKISIGSTQLTVTCFLLGYALGQLIYGPIANRLGRKPAFYVGIVIATIGSLFSILASPIESFSLLIAGRLLEALGASAGLVVCFTLINDFYYPQEARRVTSLMMVAFAVMPGVAISIGGILTQYINWQACFYFLLLYGLILIYPVRKLPETICKRDPHALRFKYVLKNYAKIILNKKLVGFSLCSGFSSACIYVFGAAGPFIGIQLLHIKPATYGLWGLTPFIGSFIGCMVNVRLTHVNPMRMLKIAFCMEVTAAIFMLICFLSHWITLGTLLIPMGLLCAGHPIMASTALSLAMNQTEDRGNGSAIMNFVAMSMPVLMTLLLGTFHTTAAWVMPFIFIIALTMIFLVYLGLLREK
jgi:DHA1 family bicyclomycin/chloramphenicol resistance-like MFS transporter